MKNNDFKSFLSKFVEIKQLIRLKKIVIIKFAEVTFDFILESGNRSIINKTSQHALFF